MWDETNRSTHENQAILFLQMKETAFGMKVLTVQPISSSLQAMIAVDSPSDQSQQQHSTN
jgi:hypothetical protein